MTAQIAVRYWYYEVIRLFEHLYYINVKSHTIHTHEYTNLNCVNSALMNFIFSLMFIHNLNGMECYIQVKYKLVTSVECFTQLLQIQYIIYTTYNNIRTMLDVTTLVNLSVRSSTKKCVMMDDGKNLFLYFIYNLPLNGRHVIHITENYLHHLQ